LEFNVPFQHKYGYIRDEGLGIDDIITVVQRHKLRLYGDVLRKDENDWVNKAWIMKWEV